MAKTNKTHQELLQNLSIYHCFAYIFSSANFTPIEAPIAVSNSKETTFFTLAHDDAAETLWIAAQGISSNAMLKTMRNIKQVVAETLDSSSLNINGILIAPTDTPKGTKTVSYADTNKQIKASKEDSNILIFDSAESAFNYLQSKPAELQPDNENVFQAYHEYLQTLVEYMNK